MIPERALFSESWHRVSAQRIRLRPSVRTRRQSFRGEIWYIAEDSFTNQFFRFRPEAYAFVARLDGTRTVEQIWMLCLERDPESAPGQGEIVSMLAQLYHANLIVSDLPPDTARLFERHQRRVRSEIKSQIFGIFFLRVRLFDPDPLLTRFWPFLRLLCTRTAGILWLVVVGLALNSLVGNWDKAVDQAQGILEPGNLLLLYTGFVMAKLIHEFGHATAVKKFGGEVHAMGVTFLVFTPIPYVDATAAWAFRERWKRVMVGLAGMIPELFFAALAAITWGSTGPGLLHSLAYNVMIVASVSTVIFNINPLLRFDGYYILADLTDSPNLQPRAAAQWKHLTETYAFKVPGLDGPGRSLTESIWLSVYGVASWSYRIFVTISIILLVADRYFGIGLLAGAVTFVGSFVVPVIGIFRYLARDPKIERVRHRAWLVSAGAAALVFVILGVIPLPRHFRAPGMAWIPGSAEVRTSTDGWLRASSYRPPSSVRKGENLIVLVNPELNLEIAAARAELEQALARERQMLIELAAGIVPMRRVRQAAETKLAELLAERDSLEVRAPSTGMWRPTTQRGMYAPRGVLLGEIVGDSPSWEFYAVVPQDYAAELFNGGARGGSLRFRGTGGEEVPVTSWRVVPGRQDTLPSPALGWGSKGPVAIKTDDPHAVHTTEPFFLVVARIDPPASTGQGRADQVLWQGRTGTIRFDLPASPLLVRWTREFRQLLQNRYQI